MWTWLSDGPYASEPICAGPSPKSSVLDRAFFSQSSRRYAALRRRVRERQRIEPAHGVVEVGNILLIPALQRTRAATEAMYLMARQSLKTSAIAATSGSATPEPTQPASRFRLGFSFEGIFRQHMVIKGTIVTPPGSPYWTTSGRRAGRHSRNG